MYKVILKVDNENLSKVVNDPDFEIVKVDQISNFLLGSKKRISKTSDELKRRFDRY
jgi:hypothetical protein|tara:strand:- start:519 stop:686 length:168 start_codon:yes stop_codon:yes gene_type:complete